MGLTSKGKRAIKKHRFTPQEIIEGLKYASRAFANESINTKKDIIELPKAFNSLHPHHHPQQQPPQ